MSRRLLLFVPLLVAAGCNKGEDDAAGTDEPAEGTEQVVPDDAISCELTGAVELIDNVRLNDGEGQCKLFLPLSVSPGTFEVRVSAAGSTDGSAVERRLEEGILYATSGTVVVTEAGDRLVGHVHAVDDAPPLTGTIVFDFDVAAPE